MLQRRKPTKSSGPVSYVVNVDSKDYTVVINDGAVKINGKDYKVAMREGSTAADATSAPAAASSGVETPVEAPVGGVILKFLRANGDAVEQDEPVLIMESMKMELEVRTKAAGVITYKAESGSTAAASQIIAVVC